MAEPGVWLSGTVVAESEALDREFDAHLAESSTLAFRVAFAVLRRREDAEDVAQDALAKAYRNFRHLRHRDRFQPWLVRTTWRLALDRQRSERRRAARESQCIEPTPEPTTVDEVVERQRAHQLWQAIDALPPKLRVVVVLAGIQGYNVGEVARLLHLAPGTVKSRLFLARQRLKDSLQWTIDDLPAR